MTNYYKTLGVPDFASDDEIKTAYRKLSKKFHPDVNQGDKFFEELFKEIQSAYEALNDFTKRKRLDDFLKQAESKNHYQGNQNQSNTESKKPHSEEQPNSGNGKAYSSTTKPNEENTNNQTPTSSTKKTTTSSFVLITIGSVVVLVYLIIAATNKKRESTNSNSSFSSSEAYNPPKQNYIYDSSPPQPYYNKEEKTYDNATPSTDNAFNSNFSIGSTKQEVLGIQGNPSSTNKFEALNQEVWYYGRSSVTFTGGKVSEYSDYGNNLRVQYSDNSTISGDNIFNSSFSIGSAKKEVLSVQGNPSSTNKFDALNQEVWYFGRSSVTFTRGKVSEYSDYGDNLRVQYFENSTNSSDNTFNSDFSIGSTKREVFRIQGNPSSTNKFDALNQEVWYFGRSSVTFTGGKVSEYSDYGNNLRVRY